jgi:hypothetical protein
MTGCVSSTLVVIPSGGAQRRSRGIAIVPPESHASSARVSIEESLLTTEVTEDAESHELAVRRPLRPLRSLRLKAFAALGCEPARLGPQQGRFVNGKTYADYADYAD